MEITQFTRQCLILHEAIGSIHNLTVDQRLQLSKKVVRSLGLIDQINEAHSGNRSHKPKHIH